MARLGKRDRVARCIYRDHTGAAIIVSGKEHRYPPGMRTAELEDERDRLERHYATHKPPKAQRGTFAADVDEFLLTIPEGPSRSTRRSELAGWKALFEKRHRFTVTPAEIRKQMTRWLDDDVPASTINKRLSALRSMYRDLAKTPTDPNPPRMVKKLEEEDTEPRDVPMDMIDRIIRAMPDQGRPEKGQRWKDGTFPTVSLSKLRLRVFQWTGFAPATIGRITAEDLVRLDQDPPQVRLAKRRKGKGVKAVWLELLPQGAEALRSLRDAGELGPFSAQSLNQAWQRACKQVRLQEEKDKVPAAERIDAHITPYQIRHSFLTMLALICKDERAVQEYAQHADIRTTRRYTERSVPPRVSAGIARLREHLTAQNLGTGRRSA